MRYDEPRLVWTRCESESNPKPRPKPSSADVAERGVASIGVRSSGNSYVEEEYVNVGGSNEEILYELSPTNGVLAS
jgi:hypothetical protein